MTIVTVYCATKNPEDVCYRIEDFICLPNLEGPALAGESITSEQGVKNMVEYLFSEPVDFVAVLSNAIGHHPLHQIDEKSFDGAVAEGRVTLVATYEFDLEYADGYLKAFRDGAFPDEE